jgi:hypothetical protein
MQQPALPNLSMAGRAGMQPGGSSTMYQQVRNLQQVANTSSGPQHVQEVLPGSASLARTLAVCLPLVV